MQKRPSPAIIRLQCSTLEDGMRMKNLVFAAIFICTSLFLSAQQGALSPAVQKYVKVTAQKIVLEHVRVIDGTGKPAADDQNIVIQGGKIIGDRKSTRLNSSHLVISYAV